MSDNIVKHITGSNFDEEVKNAKDYVLLDFWAPWCGPCKSFIPVLGDFARESGDIVVGKINIEEETELATLHRVMSIPFLVLYKDGSVVAQRAGALSLDALRDWVNSVS